MKSFRVFQVDDIDYGMHKTQTRTLLGTTSAESKESAIANITVRCGITQEALSCVYPNGHRQSHLVAIEIQ